MTKDETSMDDDESSRSRRGLSQKISNDGESPLDDEDETKCECDDGFTSNIPIDEGWAWVICAACFIITFVTSIYDQVLAVMLVDVVDKFDISVTTAAVVFTVFSFTFSVGSVISTNVLVPRFGVRVVIVSSSIVNSVTTLFLAVSMNHPFYLTIHLFKGLAVGSMWIPALGLLGHYFKRRRSFATTLTNSGIGIALLAAPSFVRELLNSYGFLGALLIISGVEMQAIAVGMLLRPPSQYRRTAKKVQSDMKTCQNQKEQCFLLEQAAAQRLVPDCETGLRQLHKNNDKTESEYSNKPSSGHENDDKEYKKQEKTEPDRNYHESSSLLSQRNDTTFQSDATNYKLLFVDTQIKEKDDILASTSTELDKSKTDHNKINADKEETCMHLNKDHFKNDNVIVYKKEYNNLNIEKKHANIDPEVNKEQDNLIENVSLSREKRPTHRFAQRAFLMKFFDMELISDWMMRLIMASTVFGALLLYIPSYIPTLAVKRDVDKVYAAMLLTICGGVSLLSSLIQGVLIDCKVISASRFVAISQIVVGSMCHLVRFFTNFPTLLLLSITQGMFGGSRLSLMPVLTMDFVGVKNLSKALGFNAMVATLSLALHHPFLGYLIQVTGDFNVTFHYVGFVLYVSSGFLLLENVGRKLNARRHNRQM